MAECQRHDLQKQNNVNDLQIILDDLDFSWERHEIKTAVKMWKQGKSIFDIADKVRPYNNINGVDETFLLLLHLARTGKIKRRKGEIFGWTEEDIKEVVMLCTT